jgi:hypothetical protein
MEQVVGALVQCPRCGLAWAASDTAHRATHRREDVVHEASMEMNLRGVNFQPGQQWHALGDLTRRRSRRTRRTT